ncbi:Hypothetical protein Minf_0131 [Methylacidiphilum infernorum V4]|uniref:Uncharacterized protein n=1 Tax=Methylacidiphilum infernorum (isolate V4) TaxID=481448 RepID=B3DX51_METI4|nr:Hypothetical protein Minf_0131 [Methylacidiphilum infernorum V4]
MDSFLREALASVSFKKIGELRWLCRIKRLDDLSHSGYFLAQFVSSKMIVQKERKP